MSTTLNKTQIQQTWNTAKIQEEAVHAMVRNMGITMGVLKELGPEAMKKFDQACTMTKVEHFKKLGVKTPFELAKAMAEFEVNVFGSKVTVWGDDKEASMEYEHCACWNAMQKEMKMDAKTEECMGTMFAEKMNSIAKAFGFSKGEVKFGDKAIVTFTK